MKVPFDIVFEEILLVLDIVQAECADLQMKPLLACVTRFIP